MNAYPKIESVSALSGKRLKVTFVTGTTKVYDCTPLLDEAPFAPLKDDAFFRNAYVDKIGYGVAWNDDVDLSEAELWLHGKIVRVEVDCAAMNHSP